MDTPATLFRSMRSMGTWRGSRRGDRVCCACHQIGTQLLLPVTAPRHVHARLAGRQAG